MPSRRFTAHADDPPDYPGLTVRMRQLRAHYGWTDAQAYAVATQEIAPNPRTLPTFHGIDGNNRPVFSIIAPGEFSDADRSLHAIGATGAIMAPHEPVREQRLIS